ncbi:EAL domain-containing protein [Hippea alviniae]|uniref:EAL domain-containing protein n=1 Tax=Hippea alviniae TaxID=1279027 RepID=UPI0003B5FE9A|nr:EAL domain-containing protein [Hippea alviniae]
MFIEGFFDAVKNSYIFGVFTYNKEGKITFANRKALEILEYSKEEFIGKHAIELIPDSKTKKLILKNMKLRSKGMVFKKEYTELTLISKNGYLIPVQLFAFTLIRNNEPFGIVIFYDKSKEQSLKKLFFALSQINQLIIRIDLEKELIEKACEVLVNTVGYLSATVGAIDEKTKEFKIKFAVSSDKELQDALYKMKVSADPNKPHGKGSISEAFLTGKVVVINDVLTNERMTYWREDQKRFKINSVCAIPIFKEDKIAYILLVHDKFRNAFSDENLKLLQELQDDLSFALTNIEKSKTLKMLTIASQSTHEWVVITDRDGKIIHTSDAVSRISEYSRDEIIGETPRIFKSGFHNEEFYKNLWNTILNGKTFSAKLINKSKTGKIFYLDAIIVPIKEQGRITNFISLAKDITEVEEYQQRLLVESKLYNTLYQITQISATSSSEDEFLKKLTKIFTDNELVDVAYIVRKQQNNYEIVHYSTIEPSLTNLVKAIHKKIQSVYTDREKIRTYPAEKALKYKKIYLINRVDKSIKPFDELLESFNLNSCCFIPIIRDGKSSGFLTLISRKSNIFDAKIFNLLRNISTQIEFTLNKFDKEKFLEIVQLATNEGFEFLVITDDRFNIVYANRKTLETFGYTEEEIYQKPYSIFFSKQSLNTLEKLQSSLKSSETFTGMITYATKDGKPESFYTTIIPFKKDNKITHFISLGKRITEEDKLKEELNRLLRYDSITGLMNLFSFKEATERFIARAKHERQLGAIAIINPVSFKSINQAFGFEMGNEILRIIGERLKKHLRSYDIIAKLESDRFGVLIKDIRREEDILVIAMKILATLTIPYNIRNHQITLPFNIGLSLFPKDGKTSEELLNKAQIALADAKAKGENQIGFFRKDLEKLTIERIKLKTELEKAIQNNEFTAYLQPYVDKDENIAGAESLIRWVKGTEVVPPSEFIPFLESTDLIISAEKLMIKTAADIIRIQKERNTKTVPLSVNISEKTLKHKYFLEDLSEILSKLSEEERQLLRFEIVERTFLKDFNPVKRIITTISLKGIQFMLDDFGTGYSSLSYLSELPVKFLKIDISFIRKLIHSKHTQNIVESIIYIANKLGIKTIAEGIEKKEQYKILKDMGCDYFQGFLFFKPMSIDDFLGTIE